MDRVRHPHFFLCADHQLSGFCKQAGIGKRLYERKEYFLYGKGGIGVDDVKLLSLFFQPRDLAKDIILKNLPPLYKPAEGQIAPNGLDCFPVLVHKNHMLRASAECFDPHASAAGEQV